MNFNLGSQNPLKIKHFTYEKNTTFFNLLLFNFCVSAQYLNKDFNDLSLTSGGWSTQIIIDTTNWFVDSFGGDDFVKATNYSNGQNVPSNTWLISPAVDLSSANTTYVII